MDGRYFWRFGDLSFNHNRTRRTTQASAAAAQVSDSPAASSTRKPTTVPIWTSVCDQWNTIKLMSSCDQTTVCIRLFQRVKAQTGAKMTQIAKSLPSASPCFPSTACYLYQMWKSKHFFPPKRQKKAARSQKRSHFQTFLLLELIKNCNIKFTFIVYYMHLNNRIPSENSA